MDIIINVKYQGSSRPSLSVTETILAFRIIIKVPEIGTEKKNNEKSMAFIGILQIEVLATRIGLTQTSLFFSSL